MNYTNMLGHAFDLVPVNSMLYRNALCTTSQSGSLVSIAQLLGLVISISSHLIWKLEKNCVKIIFFLSKLLRSTTS